uniref:Uncharacterized protein n=1 Tax=Anguilla anguilla TaxID=7936 RepID=A0A0E9X104_ANGAN
MEYTSKDFHLPLCLPQCPCTKAVGGVMKVTLKKAFDQFCHFQFFFERNSSSYSTQVFPTFNGSFSHFIFFIIS